MSELDYLEPSRGPGGFLAELAEEEWQDLGSGEAPIRSDLMWDGAINLSDIVVFTQHLGAVCQ